MGLTGPSMLGMERCPAYPHVPAGQQAWTMLGLPMSPIMGCGRLPTHISAQGAFVLGGG